MIELEIFGRPVACNSTKYSNRYNSNHYFNPKQKQIDQAKWQIRSQFNKPILNCPIQLKILYYFHVPKHTSNIKRKQMLANIIKHTKRPDRGNLDKFAEDVLKEIVFKDDSQVWDCRSQKLWCNTEKDEKTLIYVIPETYSDEF
jgi:Holliday junction resolvase RusA-like endonuclease